jgi:hypothetical protein
MRTIARSLIGLAIAALSWPAVASAQRASYDFRQHEDFARPKTFAFKNVPAVRPDSRQTTTFDTPFIDERTNAAIAAQLEQRGWTRNDESPDVYVVTRRTFWKEYTTYGPYWGPYYSPAGWWGPYPYGWGYGWSTWGVDPLYAVEEIRGNLTVDLEDAASGRLLWRGVGEKHVHERSKPSSRVRHVNDQVDDIFKKFPAGR